MLFPLAAGGVASFLRARPRQDYWLACAGLAGAFCAVSPWLLSFAGAGVTSIVVSLSVNLILPIGAAFAVRSWVQQRLLLLVLGAIAYVAVLLAGITAAVNLGLLSH